MGSYRDGHILHGDPFYMWDCCNGGTSNDMSIVLTVIGGLLWVALVWLILKFLGVCEKGEDDET